jgi:hypothetical protein
MANGDFTVNSTGMDTSTTPVLATLKSALVADAVTTAGGAQTMTSSRASHPHPNSEILGSLLASTFSKVGGYATGVYTGTNAIIAVTGLGFTPAVVVVVTIAGEPNLTVKIAGMATNTCLSIDSANGDADGNIVAVDAAITLTATGFSTVDNGDCNQDGIDSYWVALGG